MNYLEITPAAEARIATLLVKETEANPEKRGLGLRIAVIGGGCSGLQYRLGFDVATENDALQEQRGALVIVDEKSALYLVGSTLDFIDTLQESGFKIENPNVASSCGCGKSFS